MEPSYKKVYSQIYKNYLHYIKGYSEAVFVYFVNGTASARLKM